MFSEHAGSVAMTPKFKEFTFSIQASSDKSVEVINLMSQIFNDSYRNLSPEEARAAADWFRGRTAHLYQIKEEAKDQ